MRLVRVLLSLFLVVFGLVAAAFIMIAALLARLFGRGQVRIHTTAQRRTASPGAMDDVIDVESTPIKD